MSEPKIIAWLDGGPVYEQEDEYADCEGDENSERADTPEEIERYLAADRKKRKVALLSYWMPIPGTCFAVGHHGQFGRFVGDTVIEDESPEARAAWDAFEARLRCTKCHQRSCDCWGLRRP